MKVIETKHTNKRIAENQEQYNTLYATVMNDGEVISCWEFSDEEVADIIKNRKIYLHQLTFNYQDLQPVNLKTHSVLDLYYPYRMEFSNTALSVCIACLVGKDAPRECFTTDDSLFALGNPEWLTKLGFDLVEAPEIMDEQEIYIVKGSDPGDKGKYHYCLVQGMQVLHDPHPKSQGITETQAFFKLNKLK